MSAVGVASPSAHGHAMMRTATDAVKAAATSPVMRSQPTSVAAEMAITIGTNTLDTRSASRWIGAFCPCASATSRAIWARAVSEPTFVARTTRRPYVLIVAPATSAPGPTSTGSGSPVSSDSSTSRFPALDDSVSRHLLAGADDEQVAGSELGDRDEDLVPVTEDTSVLRPELEQCGESCPRAPRRAILEIAAEEDQRRDHCADLEIGLLVDSADEHDGRPAPGGERADRDQRVHRRLEMARVRERDPVEGPTGPQDDGRGQRERDPFPARELERRDHHEQGERRRQ